MEGGETGSHTHTMNLLKDLPYKHEDVSKSSCRASDAGDASDAPAAVRAVRVPAHPGAAGGRRHGLREHAHERRHDPRAGPRHDIRARGRVNERTGLAFRRAFLY